MLDGKIKKCKYLVKHGNKTSCRIFMRRLGHVIDVSKKTGKVVVCVYRSESPYDYPGCPFNTGKEIHPIWRDNPDKPTLKYLKQNKGEIQCQKRKP